MIRYIYTSTSDLIWFLFSIMFLIDFEEFLVVWIPRLFRFISIMYVIELLGKIIYLCSRYIGKIGLVSLFLMAYQLFLGYLMPKPFF